MKKEGYSKNNGKLTCENYCVHHQAVKEAKSRMLQPEQALRLAETFKILGDPNRLQLINALNENEMCVCDLSAALGTTPSAISHQLRLLRNLRLVRYRKEGKMVYYSLDDSHVVVLFKDGLEHIKHI